MATARLDTVYLQYEILVREPNNTNKGPFHLLLLYTSVEPLRFLARTCLPINFYTSLKRSIGSVIVNWPH